MSNNRQTTVGIDAGSGAVKISVMSSNAGSEGEILYHTHERIRRRNIYELVERMLEDACKQVDMEPEQFEYIASTGDGDTVPFRTGHFYTMTTHARGSLFLRPEVRSVLDVGSLHARAIRIDERGKVLVHKMTSQCASGSGQFLENIARYLGVPLADVGALSLQANDPEQVSGICAVLAETDVINMVSRGISTADILRGIHLSIANRLARLLRAIHAEGSTLLSGGLGQDAGLVQSVRDYLDGKYDRRKKQIKVKSLEILTHEDAIYAGAYGAALLGAYRHQQLKDQAA
ncbi:MAG: benzoyl-CoA reductase subunit D [Deltaproteobacteria bacterium]|nr:benzoyl-CoA reductase subunit D [Deltaproteobacteria bacterium]